MAITRRGQFIRITSQDDVIEDQLQVQAIYSRGDEISITDKDGNVMYQNPATAGEATCACQTIHFPCKIEFNGLSFSGAQGQVTVFLS